MQYVCNLMTESLHSLSYLIELSRCGQSSRSTTHYSHLLPSPYYWWFWVDPAVSKRVVYDGILYILDGDCRSINT